MLRRNGEGRYLMQEFCCCKLCLAITVLPQPHLKERHPEQYKQADKGMGVGPEEYAPYFENISIKESAKRLIAGFHFEHLSTSMDSYKLRPAGNGSQNESISESLRENRGV
jgi:hypothetical protein